MTATTPLARTTWAGAWLHERATITDQGILVAAFDQNGQAYRVRLNGFREGLLVFVDGSVLLVRSVGRDGRVVIDPRIWDMGHSARSYQEATVFPSGMLVDIKKAYTGPEQPLPLHARPAWAPEPNPFMDRQKAWALGLWAFHSGAYTHLNATTQLTVLSDGAHRNLTARDHQTSLTIPGDVEEAFFDGLERSPWGQTSWFCKAWVFTHRDDRPGIVSRAIEHTPIQMDVPSWTHHQRLAAAASIEMST
jgi:hypothetical protein